MSNPLENDLLLVVRRLPASRVREVLHYAEYVAQSIGENQEDEDPTFADVLTETEIAAMDAEDLKALADFRVTNEQTIPFEIVLTEAGINKAELGRNLSLGTTTR